ncbi:MAG: ABC transporter permease [Candidatus Cloacimonetes bacterium]|nr:ABC transporter permease [Candidatus Cloacimonadota bacterium]
MSIVIHYLITAFRNIAKQKIYTFIKIGGLAIGLTVCILIMLWVKDELSYDNFHEKNDRLFRIIIEQNLNGESSVIAVTPGALGPALLAEFPEIKAVCRFDNMGQWLLRSGEQEYIPANSGITEEFFFDLFTFKWIAGDITTAFADPRSIILTETMADKIFGSGEALGQVLEIKILGNFTVTGIMQDTHHSHLNFDFLVPFNFLPEMGIEIVELSKSNLDFINYVLLHDNADADQFDGKIRHFLDGKLGQGIFRLYLQPVRDIYLRPGTVYDPARTGDLKFVYIFSIIAFLVLLIASVNFINLATANAALRAKEISVRKINGAGKLQLMEQFLGESLLLAFLAMLLSLILVEILLPLFNNISIKNLSISMIGPGCILPWLLALVLFTGVAAGTFPAFYLTAIDPHQVIKGQFSRGRRGYFLRRLLVVMQFSISVILIIFTLTVSAQMKFIRNRNLGYDREHLAYIRLTRAMAENYQSFKQMLKLMPGVTAVAGVNQLPVGECASTPVLDWDGNTTEDMYKIYLLWTDQDFLKTFGITLELGEDHQNVESDYIADTVLLNQAAVKQMAYDDPLGKKLLISARYYTIRGVFSNFNLRTLHNGIPPLAVINDRSRARFMFVRLQLAGLNYDLKGLDKIAREFDPDTIEHFSLFDETISRHYESEYRTMTVVSCFAVLAILVSCLGLFGLASFTAEQKSREICIRKVMGANLLQLLLLLNGSFTRWILLANVIAWPIAWLVTERWLQYFTYRVGIEPLIYILTACGSLLIALGTVSFRTVSSLRTDPVKQLKYE